jgi:hypothetical protein
MDQSKELEVVIKESGLEKSQGDVILESFTSFIKEFNQLEASAAGISITDVSQKEDMLKAREIRLALKTIRVNTESTRKSLKEKALREGKAIDGIANIVKALIIPVEEYLESQEKFIENLEIANKNKVISERTNQLSQYVEDISLYNFAELSDEAFNNLLLSVKKAFDVREAEIKKIEEDRITNEARHVLWEKRQFELAPYKFFFGATEKTLTIDSTEEEFKSLLTFFVKTKKQFDIDQEAIATENAKLKEEARKKEEQDKKDKEISDAKLKEEQDARKKLEDEKHEAIRKEQEERKAEIEKERLAKLAPEKDKLTIYAEMIKNIKAPEDLSKAGLEIVKEVEVKLLAISQEIKLKIKNL